MCAGVVSQVIVWLGRGRLSNGVGSGTLRVCEVTRIVHRERANYQVNTGDVGGKCPEGMAGLADLCLRETPITVSRGRQPNVRNRATCLEVTGNHPFL